MIQMPRVCFLGIREAAIHDFYYQDQKQSKAKKNYERIHLANRRHNINHGWTVVSQAEEKSCPEGC